MNFDILPCTHFVVIAGSHAYGTNTPESDLDIKGWAIPPTEILISYVQNFDQNDTKFIRMLLRRCWGRLGIRFGFRMGDRY
jgi:hypothetical protein